MALLHLAIFHLQHKHSALHFFNGWQLIKQRPRFGRSAADFTEQRRSGCPSFPAIEIHTGYAEFFEYTLVWEGSPQKTRADPNRAMEWPAISFGLTEAN